MAAVNISEARGVCVATCECVYVEEEHSGSISAAPEEMRLQL